jgi:hypothetical protein
VAGVAGSAGAQLRVQTIHVREQVLRCSPAWRLLLVLPLEEVVPLEVDDVRRKFVRGGPVVRTAPAEEDDAEAEAREFLDEAVDPGGNAAANEGVGPFEKEHHVDRL